MKKIWNSRPVRFFRSSPKTTIGFILILVMLILCYGANLFTSYEPLFRFQGQYHTAPNAEHILGTTQLGRDVWTQAIYGGRTSIAVGTCAGALTVALGLFFGISAGYFGKVYDSIISTIVNIVMVIPSLVLILIIASFVKKMSPALICLIIGLTSWPFNSRILRAQTMSIRNREYIYSAETLGESKIRILFIEILPNMLSMISSAFVSTMIYAIMAHATLEVISFGDPLSVTWGIMLYNARNTNALATGLWWEVIGPVVGLLTFGTGLTLINFSIDEISNPKLKAQRIMGAYYKVKRKQKRLAKKQQKLSQVAQ